MSKVKLKKEGKIALITINRPEVKNALDIDTYNEFELVLKDVKEDDGIRSVVITGAGDAFCAGLDLKFAASLNGIKPVDAVPLIRRLQTIFTFEDIPKPVISAVNGFALGNGCDIALASDFVFASTNAVFGMVYTNLALIPDLGGTFRLPKLVGLAKAREMILTGDKIGGEEAFRIGLAGKLTEPDKLMDETMAFADRLAKRAPAAIAMSKAAINKGLGSDLITGQQFEAYMQSICLGGGDVVEAITAMLEQREPNFTGK